MRYLTAEEIDKITDPETYYGDAPREAEGRGLSLSF
jgi:hypothetical protein